MFLVRLLLGGGPPLFDQLQNGLTAVPQSLALLKLVKQGDNLARQRDDELVMSAFGHGTNPLSREAARHRRALLARR